MSKCQEATLEVSTTQPKELVAILRDNAPSLVPKLNLNFTVCFLLIGISFGVMLWAHSSPEGLTKTPLIFLWFAASLTCSDSKLPFIRTRTPKSGLKSQQAQHLASYRWRYQHRQLSGNGFETNSAFLAFLVAWQLHLLSVSQERPVFSYQET